MEVILDGFLGAHGDAVLFDVVGLVALLGDEDLAELFFGFAFDGVGFDHPGGDDSAGLVGLAWGDFLFDGVGGGGSFGAGAGADAAGVGAGGGGLALALAGLIGLLALAIAPAIAFAFAVALLLAGTGGLACFGGLLHGFELREGGFHGLLGVLCALAALLAGLLAALGVLLGWGFGGGLLGLIGTLLGGLLALGLLLAGALLAGLFLTLLGGGLVLRIGLVLGGLLLHRGGELVDGLGEVLGAGLRIHLILHLLDLLHERGKLCGCGEKAAIGAAGEIFGHVLDALLSIAVAGGGLGHFLGHLLGLFARGPLFFEFFLNALLKGGVLGEARDLLGEVLHVAGHPGLLGGVGVIEGGDGGFEFDGGVVEFAVGERFFRFGERVVAGRTGQGFEGFLLGLGVGVSLQILDFLSGVFGFLQGVLGGAGGLGGVFDFLVEHGLDFAPGGLEIFLFSADAGNGHDFGEGFAKGLFGRFAALFEDFCLALGFLFAQEVHLGQEAVGEGE